MTILYLIPHLFNSGGMERVLTQKLNWLCEHTPHRFVVATTETAGERELSYFPLNEKVQIFELGIEFDREFRSNLIWKYIQHVRKMAYYRERLKQLIAREKVDLVISLGGKEVAFLRQIPCRTIVETHFAMNHRRQLIEAYHPGKLWSILGLLRVRQLIRDMRYADTLVVLTERDREDWSKMGIQNVLCIPNPCYLPDTITNNPHPIVLAAGRLHPQKGFDRLIHVWRRSQTDDWKLRIVGGGPELERLLQQSKESNTFVEFGGVVHDMVHEYERAGVFVLSSRYEGLPLALIEAMWCGVPCISFDCPNGPRELLADGRGMLVPNGDTDGLASAITILLADPERRSKMALEAQKYARLTYSEDIIMPRWVNLIEKK